MYWDKQHNYWISSLSNPAPLFHDLMRSRTEREDAANPKKNYQAYIAYFTASADNQAGNGHQFGRNTYTEELKTMLSEKVRGCFNFL